MTPDPWLLARRTPAFDRDLGQVAELSYKVFNGRARAAVHLGRVFAREDRDLGYGAT